jgi:hypothetical protein
MNRTVSSATAEMLKKMDNESLASCLYAACDLALRGSRGEMPVPPKDMTADQLVRQLVTEMPKRSE